VVALLLGIANGPPGAHAATFTVNSTVDPGVGGCDVVECTLREAIIQANSATLGSDIIAFNIPGPGPHTIQPTSPLPAITAGVTIDGYTEPGSSVNTAAFSAGTNAVLMIELDGSNAGADADGLRFAGAPVSSGPSAIRGLAINRFGGDGIRISGMGGPLLGMSVEGNVIGTNLAGTADLGNGGAGVSVHQSLHTIGNTTADARNLISGNSGSGVAAVGTGAILLRRNLIGTAADGTAPLGNAGDGITVPSGGAVSALNNIVAYNGDAGIGGTASSTGGSAAASQNSIHSNAGPGLKVTGPNTPILTSAGSSGGNTIVQGTYSGSPDTEYELEFFANNMCDPSGSGEGETFIGSVFLTTDASGNATFNETFAASTPPGASITATATLGTQSSNFSECRVIPGPANDDDADGVRDDSEVSCGGDPTNPNVRPERVDGIFAGVSDDGDPEIDEALPPASSAFDCDGDGYRGASEDHVFSYLGQLSGDQKVCQEYDSSFPNPALHVRPSKRWPADLASGSFSGNKINIQDLSVFTNPVRYINKDVGSNPNDVRLDLVPGSTVGNDITVVDMATLTSSTTGFPAMFGSGVRAFNGPSCPYAP
jgi:CSLREA domain-containing protein